MDPLMTGLLAATIAGGVVEEAGKGIVREYKKPVAAKLSKIEQQNGQKLAQCLEKIKIYERLCKK